MGYTRLRQERFCKATSQLVRLFLLCVAIQAVTLLFAGPGWAQRIVLVRPNSNDAVVSDAFNRLKAELSIHKFEISVVTVDVGPDPSETLTLAANQANAIASLALVRRDEHAAIQIWLVDRISGKVAVRTLQVRSSRDAANLLAIRAVDLLRASLREFKSNEAPPPDVMNVDRGSVSPAVHELARPPQPLYALQAGLFVLYERPRLGFGVGPSLGASYRMSDALVTGLMLAGPIMGVTFKTGQGSANIRQEIGCAYLRWKFYRLPDVSIGLELIGGALFLQALGQPHAPLIGLSDDVWGLVWGSGLQSLIRLASRIELEIALRALGTLPRLGVALHDQQTTIAVPIMAGFTGLSVEL
jgi:hypothetical protein